MAKSACDGRCDTSYPGARGRGKGHVPCRFIDGNVSSFWHSNWRLSEKHKAWPSAVNKGGSKALGFEKWKVNELMSAEPTEGKIMVGLPDSGNQRVFNTYLNSAVEICSEICLVTWFLFFFFPSCAHFMRTGVEKADGWVHERLGLIIRSLPLTLQYF